MGTGRNLRLTTSNKYLEKDSPADKAQNDDRALSQVLNKVLIQALKEEGCTAEPVWAFNIDKVNLSAVFYEWLLC